jgi:hypothetical protein
MDIDDEIVSEFDVLTGDSEDLFLLQYPLRPRYRPYGDQGSLKSGSISGDTLNLSYKLNTNNINFDRTNNEFKQEFQTLLGRPTAPINKHCLGFLKDGAFHLLPLNKIFQLRPDTSHLDSVLDQRQVEDVVELTALNQEKESKKMRVFKKKEVKETTQETPVTSLTCFDMFSNESKNLMKNLSAESSGTCKFLKKEEYFSLILPPQGKSLAFIEKIRALPVVIAIEELLKESSLISTEEALEFFPNEKNIENVLFQKAVIVQNRWVRKSEVLKDPLSRDLILFLFTRKSSLKRSE